MNSLKFLIRAAMVTHTTYNCDLCMHFLAKLTYFSFIVAEFGFLNLAYTEFLFILGLMVKPSLLHYLLFVLEKTLFDILCWYVLTDQ